MIKTATISDCGKYRYKLSRVWDESKPKMAFVMLNPSTADANEDDPTIRKCIGFARRWGYGGFVVVNLFAYRTTFPIHLFMARKSGVDVVGPDNAKAIQEAIQEASYVIAAWGRNGGPTLEAFNVSKMMPEGTQAITTGKEGHPSHPLMLSYDLVPKDWKHAQL